MYAEQITYIKCIVHRQQATETHATSNPPVWDGTSKGTTNIVTWQSQL
jgi:hypothetical protein